MLIVSIGITVILVIFSVRAFISFKALEDSTGIYIEIEERASTLMDASDYLTEQVQCYTVIGKRVYLDNYFTEAFETKRREKAINAMEAVLPDSLALYELKDSMRHSEALMQREYYAMKLVLEARGETDIPEVLQSVKLSESDALLTPEEKMKLAESMVHDNEYYLQKSEVRRNLNDSLKALKNSTFTSQNGLESVARRALISVMSLIVVQTALIIMMIWLHTHLGISPVLKAVDHILESQRDQVCGGVQFIPEHPGDLLNFVICHGRHGSGGQQAGSHRERQQYRNSFSIHIPSSFSETTGSLPAGTSVLVSQAYGTQFVDITISDICAILFTIIALCFRIIASCFSVVTSFCLFSTKFLADFYLILPKQDPDHCQIVCFYKKIGALFFIFVDSKSQLFYSKLTVRNLVFFRRWHT